MMLTIVAITVAGALGLGGTRQADLDEGKAAFSENGCARCHGVETQDIVATITSERIRGPDLSQIGTERDADWLVAYMKREETLDGERHRAPYGGTDDKLRALAEWLAQLQ